ncbi:MAG: heme o synthase [Opitutae bacterium]|jgi:protoheme IX farnesyltransferase|nr:heme o synthase [Opitutae bacterium]
MGTFNNFYQLTKPRLSMLSVFSALIAYGIAPKTYLVTTDLGGLIYALAIAVGIALCAGGAAVLNQWLEYPLDDLMQRTKDRPIPAQRVSPLHALIFGLALSALGLGLLLSVSSVLTFVLALLTLVTYLLIYTPLKRVSPINTIVGAIPGALPPLIGWAAAEGTISTMGWLIFAILFFWQMPHFYALAWMYKEDYATAGFQMLPVKDPDGFLVAQRSIIYTVFLAIATLLVAAWGFASWVYLVVVIALNLYLGVRAYCFLAPENKMVNAQKLFIASILYLPILLILLLLDISFL